MSKNKWQLFRDKAGWREAQKALNEAAEKTVKLARLIAEGVKEGDADGLESAIMDAVKTEWYPVAHKWRYFGATDTEPSCKLQALLVEKVRKPHSPYTTLNLWI